MKRALILVTVVVIFLAVLVMLGCESSHVKGAKLYIAQNNFEKAREQLEKSAEAYPNDSEAFYWLGFIDGQESKWNDMLEHFNQSLAVNTKFEGKISDLKLQYFNDFLNQGVNKYNNVLTLLKEKEVDMDEINKMLNEVIAAQELALKIDPAHEKPPEILSRAFLLLGDDKKAKTLFENLLAENPNHISALSVLGNMYYEEGIRDEENKESLKKSIEYHERLIKVQPDNPRALRNLAYGYYQTGDSLKALSIFETAVANNPDDGNLHLNFGKILYETGAKEKAELEFKKSLELMPDNVPALKNLARFYVMDVKDFEMAMVPLNKLIELAPETADSWELIGICQANLGNKTEAEEAFKKAEELRKSAP